MSKIIQIDGGIGRVICATAAVSQYAQDNSKVIVVSSWPDIFWHNPYVHKCYRLDHPYLWDDVIKHGDFIHPEPYHSKAYYTQEHHLSASFNFLINGVASRDLTPHIFLSRDEIANAKKLADHVRRTIGKDALVAYQPYGAGAVLDENAVFDVSNRSLSKVAAEFIANNSHVAFINCSHIFVDCKNVWNQQFSLRELLAIVSVCDAVVCVDSCVSHIGAAFNKKGISILGATFKANVGYPFYKTFQREGYPKSYVPNRFHGAIDNNQGAMDFTEKDLFAIIDAINGDL